MLFKRHEQAVTVRNGSSMVDFFQYGRLFLAIPKAVRTKLNEMGIDTDDDTGVNKDNKGK